MTQRPASPVPWIVVVATAGVLAAGEWMVTGTPAFGSGHILRAPALALLAAGCALLLALRPAPPRVAVLTGWHGLALLLPLAIPLLGLLAAPDHRTASHLLRDATPWMAMAVLPWGLARTLDRPSLLPHLWRLLVAVGLALALCGLGERLAGHRMAAGFGRPAVAATVFGILLVPAWVHSPFAGGLLRALPPLVFLGAVAASGSRAAWIATAVTGLLTLGPRLPVLRARPRIAPLVAGGIVLLGGLAYAGVVPLPGGNETLEVRRGLHGGALELMAERPLTGHGLGAYPVEALRVRDVAEARLEPGRRPFHAHADLLHVGTEGGVLAALALLAWILTGLLRARALLRDGDPLRRSAGQVGGAALLMPAVVGLADGALLAPGPLLLACVGWATLLRAGPSATEAGAAVRQMPAWIVKGAGPWRRWPWRVASGSWPGTPAWTMPSSRTWPSGPR